MQWYVFQHGTSDCVVCALELKAVTRVCSPNQHVTYLQTAVWILHKLLSRYQKLRITIQGITVLNIIFENAVCEVVGMNVGEWNGISGTCKTEIMTKRHYNSCTLRLCVCVCQHIHLSHLQMHVLGLSICVCVCVRACVISVFWESQGPCFPCGALVLALWGGCRSCHYNWCGESSESCYLKAHQH